jgi:YHS domain-containing protein
MSKDPVCGMEVDEATAPHRSHYQGQMYFFCSRACKEAFDKTPDTFVSHADQQLHPSDTGHQRR